MRQIYSGEKSYYTCSLDSNKSGSSGCLNSLIKSLNRTNQFGVYNDTIRNQ